MGRGEKGFGGGRGFGGRVGGGRFGGGGGRFASGGYRGGYGGGGITDVRIDVPVMITGPTWTPAAKIMTDEVLPMFTNECYICYSGYLL
jgi:H/ACA ribonucleoprotein complex subunit 1